MASTINIQPTAPSTDHDMLIRLDSKFDTFLVQYTIDIKRLESGTMAKIAAIEAVQVTHETRLDELNRIVAIVKPEETLKDYYNFKLRVNNLLVGAGVIGGIVMFLLTQLPGILKNFGVL